MRDVLVDFGVSVVATPGNKESCISNNAFHAACTTFIDSGSGVSEGRYIKDGVIASSKTLPKPV